MEYKIEFEPVDLLFDVSYNKFINIDDGKFDFKALDFILFNLKISKEFSI